MSLRKYKYDVNYYDLGDKQNSVSDEIDYMLIRTLKMFKWRNLPNSIPKRTLELFLQTGGVVCFTDKPDGVLRVFFGGLGGEPDEYYRSTVFTVANPSLKFSKELSIVWDENTIDNDCVIMLNDALYKGLLPLHRKYSTMIIENQLSLKVADINARIPWILASDDERTRKSAEEFLRNILDGKLGVIENASFLEGLKEFQLSNQNHMLFSGLIEYQQYILSAWYENIGINEIMNGMKKEYVSNSEEKMSEDSLLPLVDQMLEERKRACELINKKYGTNIDVEFDSSWEDNIQEIELNHEILEEQANEKNDDNNTGTEETEPNEEREEIPQDEDTDNTVGNDDINEEVTDDESETTSETSVTNIEVNIEVNNDDENIEEEVTNNDE